jgi:hypothetical protein
MLARWWTTLAIALVALIMTPNGAWAQSMRDVLNDLFVFSSGENPLFLGGSAGVPGTEVHGDHFIPSETETNATLLDFFNNAIAANIGSFPLSSTVSSETFVFVGGVPQPTSNSFGPIFAERAPTVGRGRLNAAVNYTRLRLNQIRGVDLDDVRLTFVHDDVDFPNCDQIFGGDCSAFGVPQFENDEIDLTLGLDLEVDLYALSVTYGLTDWLDVSVAVPVIDIELEGSSRASITPTTGEEVLHFFGGTPESPILEERNRASERTTGIGDVAGRLKARLVQAETWSFGLLGEIRAPTGREEDFLGTGEVSARSLAILSGSFGGFSPHANAGYEFVGGDLVQDEVELLAGFDHRLADWVTLAVDFLGSFKVGDEKLAFPEPARIEAPFPRTIRLTNIPSRRDDVVDGSLGFKFRTGGGLVVVTNVLVPLNEGGLRPSPTPTLGLEYSP